MIPGHQVVDVARVRSLDRPSEHVAKQQHEDHRLHEQVDDVHRPTEHFAQLARRHHAAVGRCLGQRDAAAGRDCLGGGAHHAASCSSFGSVGRPLGGMAGEVQEYIVERRLMQLDGCNLELPGVEPPHRLGRGARILDGQPDLAVGGVDVRLLGGAEPGKRRRGFMRGGVVGQADAQDRRADCGLQLGRGALGRDPAMVHHGDPLCEPICLLQVLGREQHRRAVPSQLVDDPPQLLPRAGVESGGRLVEQHDRRPSDQSGGEVEPAAHPAGVGRDTTVGGLDEVEPLEHARRATARLARRQPVEARDHLDVLPAGELSRRPPRTDPRGRSAAGRRAARARRHSRAPLPGRCWARATSPGSGRASSCRLRSGRAARKRCRPARSGQARRARRPRRSVLPTPVDLDCITHGPSLPNAARRCAGPRGGS